MTVFQMSIKTGVFNSLFKTSAYSAERNDMGRSFYNFEALAWEDLLPRVFKRMCGTVSK